MKKKILILTLCFSLVFGGLNLKKSYADGGIISLPMLATVSALAVGSNIVINNNDDLYDIGRMFYDYVDRHNDLTWSTVQSVFLSSVSLLPSKLVSVKSDFLDIVKGFFDDTFSTVDYSDIVFSEYGLPYFSTDQKKQVYYDKGYKVKVSPSNFSVGSFDYVYVSTKGSYFVFDLYLEGKLVQSGVNLKNIVGLYSFVNFEYWGVSRGPYIGAFYKEGSSYSYDSLIVLPSFASITFPYNGGYVWDDSRLNEDNELSLPIPGDLGSLVGQTSDKFWGNTDNLVGNGNLVLPGVNNPSINLDDLIGFPSVDSPSVPSNPSVPSEGIWTTIKDFIIGLVVPSDTFWTDTWGGLYNNFTSSFPMVDMDGFNDLVTGEKKFPNIDINIMGVTGRVVNGDVVNSIVDWLRPIIAGFMMLCLMLFNYRKIYKLIRNSEPFGGIAPGTSDFSTGISEYNKESSIKAVDMVSEYRAFKERGVK